MFLEMLENVLKRNSKVYAEINHEECGKEGKFLVLQRGCGLPSHLKKL